MKTSILSFLLHQTDEISICISSINAIGDLCLKFILQANLCSMSRPPVCYWFLSCLRGKRNMMLLFEDLIFCQKWREYMYLNCAAFFHCWTNKSIKIMLNYKKRRKENVLGVRMQVGKCHCVTLLPHSGMVKKRSSRQRTCCWCTKLNVLGPGSE